jgi:hypothetical protein
MIAETYFLVLCLVAEPCDVVLMDAPAPICTAWIEAYRTLEGKDQQASRISLAQCRNARTGKLFAEYLGQTQPEE